MPSSEWKRSRIVEQTIKNTAIKVAGLVLTIVGLIIFALPLPLGIPLTAVGLMMLISTSKTARRFMRYLRIRSSLADRMFTLVETKVPGPTRNVLRKTRRRSIGRPVDYPTGGS